MKCRNCRDGEGNRREVMPDELGDYIHVGYVQPEGDGDPVPVPGSYMCDPSFTGSRQWWDAERTDSFAVPR